MQTDVRSVSHTCANADYRLFFFLHLESAFAGKHKPEERSEFIHYHPNVTNWSKAGLMMGQNANVGKLRLLGAAGLIYEFACVLQPNTAQISRHFPRDVAAAQSTSGRQLVLGFVHAHISE